MSKTALDRLICELERLQSWYVRQTGAQEPVLTPLIADARQEQAELVEVLKRLQWCGRSDATEDGTVFSECPECGQFDFRGHKQGCELAALLAKHGGG